jgi:hypothetical protein
MILTNAIAGWLLAGLAVVAAPAQQPSDVPELTAAQVVEKNAAARGGVEAWRKIETMAWTGHTESSASPGRKLPFLLEQRRPSNVRFELIAEGQKSVRFYDGTNGWKLRAASNGKPELRPYSADELRYARGAQVIDGPLMDYTAKGGVIALIGIDAVEGRKAYLLDVKLPSGGLHRVWVDAETFLEVRHDREYRNAAGQPAIASVFYRDYRPFEGLQIPVTIETGGMAGRPSNKLMIDRVALNPPLEDRMFARPSTPVSRHRGAIVDTRSAASQNPGR